MFSFHKPKIYRSSLGCCICKAKSSSSRFTDSKKYEAEFERCFRIDEKRSGEICNACVLLVKRWKKLSPENRSSKHWHHVVDARAGPGTKLSTNRRLININNNTTGNNDNGSSIGNNSKHKSSSRDNETGKSDHILPLSSSQSGNYGPSTSTSGSSSSHLASSSANHHHHLYTASTSSKRSSSFSKALAIDTNVSTFTFGEPQRRTYGESYNPYATQHLYPASSYAASNSGANLNNSSSSSSFGKPQSALSSSAFESVMKRYRQRQQQEQLKAQKRQQQLANKAGVASAACNNTKKHKPTTKEPSASSSSEQPIDDRTPLNQKNCQQLNVNAATSKKRQHRISETSLSQSLDGFKVSTILDSNIWRREKTCCGIIFRGINQEVAIFPKLFKPCQERLQNAQQQHQQPRQQQQIDDVEQEPSPRTTKSGSVSSCDSNTSGTGSMDPSNFDSHIDVRSTSSNEQLLLENNSRILNRPVILQRGSNLAKRPSNIPTILAKSNLAPKRGRPAKLTLPPVVSATSTTTSIKQAAISGTLDSPTDSSSNSSISALSGSMLLNCNPDCDEGDEAEIVDDEDECEEDDEELVDEDEDEELDEESVLVESSSSHMADEETKDSNADDASSSIDSLVSGGQKARVN